MNLDLVKVPRCIYYACAYEIGDYTGISAYLQVVLSIPADLRRVVSVQLDNTPKRYIPWL